MSDSTSLPDEVPDYSAALTGDVSGLRIGLPREYYEAEGANPDVIARVREAVAELERAGASVREISLPHTRYAIAIYYLIATAEASANLARFDARSFTQHIEQAKHEVEVSACCAITLQRFQDRFTKRDARRAEGGSRHRTIQQHRIIVV